MSSIFWISMLIPLVIGILVGSVLLRASIWFFNRMTGGHEFETEGVEDGFQDQPTNVAPIDDQNPFATPQSLATSKPAASKNGIRPISFPKAIVVMILVTVFSFIINFAISALLESILNVGTGNSPTGEIREVTGFMLLGFSFLLQFGLLTICVAKITPTSLGKAAVVGVIFFVIMFILAVFLAIVAIFAAMMAQT